MVKFIKVGIDRIKLNTIERYGIKCGVLYLVKYTEYVDDNEYCASVVDFD